jgi:hypothetical protein
MITSQAEGDAASARDKWVRMATPENGRALPLIVFFNPKTALLQTVSHLAKYIHGWETHAPPLVWAESLVERLPCISELLEIGGSLGQHIGAPLGETSRLGRVRSSGRAPPATH